MLALGLTLCGLLIIRLPFEQLRDGAGDMWIAMGALAISTLAAADLSSALHSATLRVVTLLAWIGASCWISILVISELNWRRLCYESKRWRSVLPLGMCAANSEAAGHLLRLGLLLRVCEAFLWIAVAAWLIVAVGAMRSLLTQAGSPVGRAGGP